VAPRGASEVFRHYIRDLVYGANDGIITTFAVVAGVTGGALSVRAVLVVGAANLVADGLSMGVGNYLGIRSEEGARRARQLAEQESQPARHGLATFVAFVLAGVIPLIAFILPAVPADRFAIACVLTLAALFGVGALRSAVTGEHWLGSGFEMLALGAIVAAAAYGAGAVVSLMVGD
jgi:VIT1/CCC1 family predicted Fe2+/Mn2+ transporter